MTQWHPATEVESALRTALLGGDQDGYFRTLSRVELLLPVTGDGSSANWGTWTTEGRTYVLAFTSADAMRTCLGGYTGPYRLVGFEDFASAWPNEEWWLAVDPGLPIESYLPPWFIAQVGRELRLPGRTRGARARLEHAAALRAGVANQTTPAPKPAQRPVTLAQHAGPVDESGRALPGVLTRGAMARATPSGRPTAAAEAPEDGQTGAGPHAGAATPGRSWDQPPGGPPVSAQPGRASVPAAPAAPAPDAPFGGLRRRPLAEANHPAFAPPGSAPVGDRAAAPAVPAAAPLGAAPVTSAVPAQSNRGGLPQRPLTRSEGQPRSEPGRFGDEQSRPGVPAAQSPLSVPTQPVPTQRPPSQGGAPRTMPTAPPLRRPSGPGGDAASALPPTFGAAVRSSSVAAAAPVSSGPAPGAAVAPGGFGAGTEAARTQPGAPQWPGMPDQADDVAPVANGTGGAAEPDNPRARHAERFVPANQVEQSLLEAADDGNTDRFLSTLLLAKVLVPGAEDDVADPERWRIEEIEGTPYLVVFTSPERVAAHLGPGRVTAEIKFTQLIRGWPDESLSFAVNPGTRIGATLPGAQIVALASWAEEMGLTDEPPAEETTAQVPAPQSKVNGIIGGERSVVMQKTVSAAQLAYYLDRGYDRVSGFVHRSSEVGHLRTPAALFTALGLYYPGSPFKPEDREVYVLRWTAHRGNLYRIPYGGQHEAGMRAMRGWVIERPPFRGNGFAPSDSGDVIAEFKVDSVRLPHGAELLRLGNDGVETLLATLDADTAAWRRGDA